MSALGQPNPSPQSHQAPAPERQEPGSSKGKLLIIVGLVVVVAAAAWQILPAAETGEAVPVPDRKVPVFKVSKELKDMVANA